MFDQHAQPKQIKAQAETLPTFFRAKLEQLESRTLLSLNVAGANALELVRHFEPQNDAPVPAALVNLFHRMAERAILSTDEPIASQFIQTNDLWIGRTDELSNIDSLLLEKSSSIWNHTESSLPELREISFSVHEFNLSDANGNANVDLLFVKLQEAAQTDSGWNRVDVSDNRWKVDSFDPRPNNGIGGGHDFGLGDRPIDWVDYGIDPINKPPSQPPGPPREIDVPPIVVLPTVTSQNSNGPASASRQTFEVTAKLHTMDRHETVQLAQTQTWHNAETIPWNYDKVRQPEELWNSDAIADCVETNDDTAAATTVCGDNHASESPDSAAEYVEAVRDIAAAGAFAVMLAPPLSRLLTACPIMTPDGPISPLQMLWAWVRRRKAKRPGTNEAPNDEPADEVVSYEPIEAAILDMISSAADKSIKLFRENPAIAMAGGICAGGAAVATVWSGGEFRSETSSRRTRQKKPVAPLNDGTTHLEMSLT